MHVKFSAPNAVNPNELWAVTLHDWSCEHETTLRKAFETAEGLDKPVENVSVENFVSSLQAHQASVSDENLQRIIMEHDKNRESVINVNDFFQRPQVPPEGLCHLILRSEAGKEGKGWQGKEEWQICLIIAHMHNAT